MRRSAVRGTTLVELLMALAIGALLGAMVLPWFLAFQGRSLTEINRRNLQDRAERLLRFMANDLREAAFQTGLRPRLADGTPLVLIHDSQPGDPEEPFNWALVPGNGGGNHDDRLTMVKAVSFAPPLRLWLEAEAGSHELVLNRQPNLPPASSREFLPSPEAINQIIPGNQPYCYTVTVADQTTCLEQPLAVAVPAGTELLGVRAYDYFLEPHAGTGRLRRDDYTSREILDDAVDGLQFEYLLADGSLVNQPDQCDLIRGVKIHLLVRDLWRDPDYRDQQTYTAGDGTYGPFRDQYRRVLVTQLVEVRNHGIQ